MRPSELNDIIEFNVGGFAYTTSRTTVISCPDSMLARMISGSIPTATDTKGRIFIDRDGPLFRHVLNYLRDKRLNLPENFAEHAQLRQEADFYRIESMIGEIDSLYFKLNPNHKNNIISSSLSSLTSNLSNGSNALLAEQQTSSSKGLYFTIVSKLYQGTVESIIGCIRILSVLSSLDSNSKRFLRSLVVQSPQNLLRSSNTNNHNNNHHHHHHAQQQPHQNHANGHNNNNTNNNNNRHSTNANILDTFVCECKFMQEEKIICCKPCGLNNTSDQSITSLCQAIVRLAKRYGITTGYWEDMFYLTFDTSMPNREQLCSVLNNKFNAKLLNSSVCDRRSSYDENSTSTLVERWFLPDISSLNTTTTNE